MVTSIMANNSCLAPIGGRLEGYSPLVTQTQMLHCVKMRQSKNTLLARFRNRAVPRSRMRAIDPCTDPSSNADFSSPPPAVGISPPARPDSTSEKKFQQRDTPVKPSEIGLRWGRRQARIVHPFSSPANRSMAEPCPGVRRHGDAGKKSKERNTPVKPSVSAST